MPLVNPKQIAFKTFTLLGGYPTYKIEHGGMSAERRGILPWDQLDSFVQSILPPSTYIGGNYTYQKGVQFPNRPNLRACSLDIKPYVDRTRVQEALGPDYKHDYWDVTIYYKSDNDPYFSHNWSAGGEVFTVAESGLAWDSIYYGFSSSGTTLGSSPNVASFDSKGIGVLRGVRPAQSDKLTPRLLVPHIEHQITWHRVVRPPYTAIRRCLGKVNGPKLSSSGIPVVVNGVADDGSLMLRTGKVPKECMLLGGVQINRIVLVDGNWSFEIVYKMSERQVEAEDQTDKGGWNHYFRAAAKKIIDVRFIPSNFQGVGDYETSYCTGGPGFYRLEKTADRPVSTSTIFDKDGIPTQVNPCDSSAAVVPDYFSSTLTYNEYVDKYFKNYTTGYQKETAIYQQEDFDGLFLPEPVDGEDPKKDPHEPDFITP